MTPTKHAGLRRLGLSFVVMCAVSTLGADAPEFKVTGRLLKEDGSACKGAKVMITNLSPEGFPQLVYDDGQMLNPTATVDVSGAFNIVVKAGFLEASSFGVIWQCEAIDRQGFASGTDRKAIKYQLPGDGKESDIGTITIRAK